MTPAGHPLPRAGKAQDAETLAALWLRASLQAHSFIPDSYWREHADAMCRQYLPQSENWVIDDARGCPVAFLSLLGEHIAALFTDPPCQGKGYGGILLRHAQQRHRHLSLQVYALNERALLFYKRHGFVATAAQADEATGAAEWMMHWHR